MLIEIVTALVISIGLLEETLTSAAIVGAALVLAAVYLVSSSPPEEMHSVTHT